MTRAEIRLKAADLLASRPDAWAPGTSRLRLSTGKYTYCMIGACREAAGYYEAYAAYAIAIDGARVAGGTTTAYETASGVLASVDTLAINAAYDSIPDGGAYTTHANAIDDVNEWDNAQGRTRAEVIAALRGEG